MDPNNNQPQPGQQPVDPAFQPPRPQPDWQQGLGGMPMPQGPLAPTPATPGPHLPGSAPSLAPRPGELSVPAAPGQPQPPQPPTPMPTAPPAPQQLPPRPAFTPPPPLSPVTPPTPNMGAGVPRSGTGHRLQMGVIIIAVLLLLGIGVVYFFTHRKASDDTAGSASTGNTQAVDLATLAKVTLMPPDKIDGYTARQTGTANIKDYVSADGACEFIVGTTSAAQLPGNDLNAIVKPQLDQLRAAGATVKGPSNGSMLTLKNADDASKTYSLPTINYEFSQDKKHAIIHYSAVVLSNGDRVVVNRTCINQNGDADKAKLDALDEKAKAVQVMIGN